jgi:hypothetical protein
MSPERSGANPKGLSLDPDMLKQGRKSAGPQTARAGTTNRGLFSDEESFGDESSMMSTQSNILNSKERMEFEYLKKRDPMIEFFSLVSLSFVSNLFRP